MVIRKAFLFQGCAGGNPWTIVFKIKQIELIFLVQEKITDIDCLASHAKGAGAKTASSVIELVLDDGLELLLAIEEPYKYSLFFNGLVFNAEISFFGESVATDLAICEYAADVGIFNLRLCGEAFVEVIGGNIVGISIASDCGRGDYAANIVAKMVGVDMEIRAQAEIPVHELECEGLMC